MESGETGRPVTELIRVDGRTYAVSQDGDKFIVRPLPMRAWQDPRTRSRARESSAGARSPEEPPWRQR